MGTKCTHMQSYSITAGSSVHWSIGPSLRWKMATSIHVDDCAERRVRAALHHFRTNLMRYLCLRRMWVDESCAEHFHTHSDWNWVFRSRFSIAHGVRARIEFVYILFQFWNCFSRLLHSKTKSKNAFRWCCEKIIKVFLSPFASFQISIEANISD